MRRRNDNDGALGCVVILMIGIFAMPLVGLYMLATGDQEKKAIGLMLTIIGFVLWFLVFLKS